MSEIEPAELRTAVLREQRRALAGLNGNVARGPSTGTFLKMLALSAADSGQADRPFRPMLRNLPADRDAAEAIARRRRED